MKEIVITHGVRTPIGKFGASLSNVSDLELASLVLENLVKERAKLNPEEIDHVILGEVRQSSEPSNIARTAALSCNIPEKVPAYTVHRQCGSGLQAIMDAYQLIACGEARIVVAGGAENMSQSSYFMRNTASGLGTGNYTIEDSLVAGGPGSTPVRLYGNLPMGVTAENLAESYGISRDEQDRFAQRSQERMAKAMEEGRFDEQILPVELKTKDGARMFSKDEHPFLTTYEKISTLKPVFKKEGTVTAANSSGRNDGAAAVLIMDREVAKRLGYQPLAIIRGIGSSGCDPRMMGLGPVRSTQIALQKTGLTIHDLDVIELNEAFAAQSIAVIEEWKKWGISEEELIEKINPNGGAIAHGHPLGCTGAALSVKCMYELKRVPEKRLGLITLCCAGGLGVAVILEKAV
ncbi:thiolase family protein [Lacrimispora sp.]|uniref:thiolase family protein n=1 Tax=Lacrimispora sp. TaxID=2719234 RepID=UPI0028A6CA36|nr:thiolase family protein [Lacrimispora sp.]